MSELAREVRYAVDKVLRNRGYENHAADAEIYAETLDEITTEVMSVINHERTS